MHRLEVCYQRLGTAVSVTVSAVPVLHLCYLQGFSHKSTPGSAVLTSWAKVA